MDISQNEIVEPTLQSPSNEIDQLTMSLLMNKQTYNKYIAKQDPEKARLIQNHNEEIQKYKTKILSLTQHKLDDPNMQVTNDIDDVFDAYVKTLIRHFQQKEIENTSQYSEHREEETNMMFEKIDPTEVHTTPKTPSSSYWGKQQVLKQNYLSTDFFSKNKYK